MNTGDIEIKFNYWVWVKPLSVKSFPAPAEWNGNGRVPRLLMASAFIRLRC